MLIDHPTTPYASNNPADVRRQMRQAKSAGIDSFVVSWAGPGTQSDKNFAMMLNQAKSLGFKVGIFLEILDNNSTVRPASQLIRGRTTWSRVSERSGAAQGERPGFSRCPTSPTTSR